MDAANTTPTVAALTVATVGATAVSSGSDRPARRSKTSSQNPAARPSTTSTHSTHASTPDRLAIRAAPVTAMPLAVPRSPRPRHPASSVTYQRGRSPSQHRYGRR
jgi:hypothetical protein